MPRDEPTPDHDGLMAITRAFATAELREMQHEYMRALVAIDLVLDERKQQKK